MKNVLFSSKSAMWETPQDLFNRLDKIYKFTTDVCAVAANAKCKHFYTPKCNGLQQHWKGVCWMNPPYGRNVTEKWVAKAYEESKKECTIIALLPGRTDTRWFHTYIYKKRGVHVTFLKGRLKFSNSKHAAPFPSMIVAFGVKNRKLGFKACYSI